MPHGPLERFVFMQAQPVPTADGFDVRISYRCWPENRYVEVRQAVNRLGPAVFASDPFPAMVTPERDGRRLQRYLERTERIGVMPVPASRPAIRTTSRSTRMRGPSAMASERWPDGWRLEPERVDQRARWVALRRYRTKSMYSSPATPAVTQRLAVAAVSSARPPAVTSIDDGR